MLKLTGLDELSSHYFCGGDMKVEKSLKKFALHANNRVQCQIVLAMTHDNTNKEMQ